MADTLDLIALSEGKAAINIASTDTTQDTELKGYITAISRRIDSLCGPVVRRLYQDEDHLTYGNTYIDLRTPPIYSVEGVVEYDQDGVHTHLTEETVTTKPVSAWLVDPSTKVQFRVLRRSEGLPYTFPYGGIVRVEYYAGRYLDTAAVDAVFKQAAAIMLAHLWRREQGVGSSTFGLATEGGMGGTPTFAVPRAVLELLAEHLRPMGIA
jgi:hypothetical protein